jgi:hypothetical protein
MNLVLEGPDNAGKTTLARRLLTVFGVSYYHPGGPPADWIGELTCLNQQRDMLLFQSSLILDRATCISQQVYSSNQSDAAKLIRAANVQRILESGALFVYCRPSTDRLLRVAEFTWRPGETEEHKQKIIQGQHGFVEAYDRVMAKVPCIHYDYDSETALSLVELLVEALAGGVAAKNWLSSQLIKGAR